MMSENRRPQGGVIFWITLYKWPYWTVSFNITIKLFADDVKLYVKVIGLADELIWVTECTFCPCLVG